MKTSDRNGLVVAVLPVSDESQIMIITNQGKLIRMETKGIRVSGRSTQGVKLIDASDGDLVSSASLIERQAPSPPRRLVASILPDACSDPHRRMPSGR